MNVHISNLDCICEIFIPTFYSWSAWDLWLEPAKQQAWGSSFRNWGCPLSINLWCASLGESCTRRGVSHLPHPVPWKGCCSDCCGLPFDLLVRDRTLYALCSLAVGWPPHTSAPHPLVQSSFSFLSIQGYAGLATLVGKAIPVCFMCQRCEIW